MTISNHTKAKVLKQIKNFSWKFGRGILLFGICFVILYPIITKFMISFMSIEDVYDNSVRYIPRNFTLENYANAFEILELDSIVLTSSSTRNFITYSYVCKYISSIWICKI